MQTTRFSTKGQIILPKKIRISRDWKAGTEFSVEETKDGVLLRPKALISPSKLEEVVGFLKSKSGTKTLAQMDAGIAEEVQRRYDSGRY